MADREKVIKGLECCAVKIVTPDAVQHCGICPYDRERNGEMDFDCRNDLLCAALELLKAQEPRVMTLDEVLEWAKTPAEKRDPIFFEQKKGKGPSGWICNSLCPKDYYLCCLDKDARCWTSRPTEEQRKAVKWDD